MNTTPLLRVLSVVTLISPDAAFGGPMRVAFNQASALQELGHEVTILAGARGYDRAPSLISGVPVRLFRARTALPKAGFAGLVAPGLPRWLHANVRRFDVVHIHVARDPITLPAARLAIHRGVPTVLQPHGMIDPTAKRLGRILDAALTRKTLQSAQFLLPLTDAERQQLTQVADISPMRFRELRNGIVARDTPHTAAQHDEVLFVARLAPVKRPELFAEMANALSSEFPNVRFTLVGPDEGLAGRVQSLARANSALSWEGAIDPQEVPRRMASSTIFVLPSRTESFGMAALEAMSVGRPVVVSPGCQIAQTVRDNGCGLVFDDTLGGLVAAVRELLSNRPRAEQMGMAGRETVKRLYEMRHVVRELEAIYREAIDPRAGN